MVIKKTFRNVSDNKVGDISGRGEFKRLSAEMSNVVEMCYRFLLRRFVTVHYLCGFVTETSICVEMCYRVLLTIVTCRDKWLHQGKALYRLI